MSEDTSSESIFISSFFRDLDLSSRYNWQRSVRYIYPANRIILTCYYNRNEPETVLADQLKQASRMVSLRLTGSPQLPEKVSVPFESHGDIMHTPQDPRLRMTLRYEVEPCME